MSETRNEAGEQKKGGIETRKGGTSSRETSPRWMRKGQGDREVLFAM